MNEVEGLRAREAGLAAEVASLRVALSSRAGDTAIRRALDGSPDMAVIATDVCGGVTSWNLGAERLFGWTAQEMLGQTLERLFTDSDLAAGIVEGEREQALREGQAEREGFRLHKTQGPFWTAAVLMPLRDEDERPTGVLKVLRDRSGQRRREDALRQELVAQELLVREVSHRVKNSLALVTSMLAMQARATDDEDVRSAFRDAEGRIRMVADVHDRMWRHGETATVDLQAFLGDLCAYLRRQSPEHDLHCDLEPASAPTDQAAPIGLLANELIINAFKHAYPGGGGGPVTMSLRADKNGPIRIEVSDKGRGLPDGFDPRHVNGSLGMRLINGLTRQLNGALSVAATPRGARFCVDIPRAN